MKAHMWGSLAVLSTILLQTLVHGLLRDTVSAPLALRRVSACQTCLMLIASLPLAACLICLIWLLINAPAHTF